MERQLVILLFLLSFLSICDGFSIAINRAFKIPLNPGQPNTPAPSFDDCTPRIDSFIQQAFADAVDHATAARDIVNRGSRAPRFTNLYDKLFTDTTVENGRPAPFDIADKYDDIVAGRSLPGVITVHCTEDWAQALFSLRSKAGLSNTFVGCGDENIATVFTIESHATGSAVTWGFGGSSDAFSTGTHILLCPSFFDFPNLSNLKPAAVGRRIDEQRTQGMVLLHELFHITSRDILDGGYGYQGCVNVANGVYPDPRLKRVKPTFNADTYALFSLACVPNGNMDQFDWTTGVAVNA
ncbi:hypothetical protein CORC01_08638 [Colletotrichum orchidophilum]|uniref:Lysine-specific metallo-endopeptidase domain-containing protein n=1 Tax=Colletotrichum orchidophilum TaxID=1209926 RepID=A0A1G4B3W8_9PEZI|nr:uncharacterized protein CORC01_08638 [Colletotrichum orchidophilum]OHE96101.1 hypothetical protein CORC01_08638 [Colletotrichum orchidophilum]